MPPVEAAEAVAFAASVPCCLAAAMVSRYCFSIAVTCWVACSTGKPLAFARACLRREIEAEPSLQKRPDSEILHQLENDPADDRLN